MSRGRWIAIAAVVLAAGGAWLLLRPDGAGVTLLALDSRSGHELWRTKLDGFAIRGGTLRETGDVTQLAAFRQTGACRSLPYTLRLKATDGHLTSNRPRFVDNLSGPPVTDGPVEYRLSPIGPDQLALDASNTDTHAVLWHRTLAHVDTPQLEAGGGVVVLHSFAAPFSGRFTVFDGETGRLLWRATAQRARVVPGADDGRVYVATGSSVSARDNRTGTVEWAVRAPRAADAEPLDPAMLASRNGLVAVARGAGLGVYDREGHVVFTTHFAHPQTSALYVGQRTIYVGIDSHYIHCDN